jgi:tellurite resistance protein TerC
MEESRVGLDTPIPYLRRVKRVVVAVIGFTVLIIGFLGVVLPLVPAFILIPAGLAILATEFVWARRWVKRARAMLQREQGGDAEVVKSKDPKAAREG